MVGNTSPYVLCGLVVAVAGLGLALIGLGLARQDVDAVRRAGVNGLVLYLAKSGRRSWTVRVSVQAMLLTFMLVVLASVPVVPPPAADPWVATSLEFRRWLMTAVSTLIAAQSAMDLWARREAAHIAEGLHG